MLIVLLGILVGLDARAQRAEMGAGYPEQTQNPASLNAGYSPPAPQTREELIRRADSLSGSWQIQRTETEQRAAALGIPVRRQIDDKTKEIQFFREGRPYYYITYNLDAAITTSTNKLWSGSGGGFDLNGISETLGIWDAGRVLVPHQEFGGRAQQRDGANTNNDHATHVAGTMMAGGFVNAARGMAGAASLDAYDWNNDFSEMMQAAAEGLRVSNHSYGFITGWHWTGDIWRWYGHPDETEARGFGLYDHNSQNWDHLAFVAPYYLIVKAAGNDRGFGPASQPIIHQVNIGGNWVNDSSTVRQVGGGDDGFDCLPYNSVAKNILTVGAVHDIAGGYSQPSDVVMSSFSSWGPTDDGRIKPDLVGNGIGLYSASSSGNTAYSTKSGTSMAAPNVSGSIGLLLQLYRQIHGHDSIRSATMKALLIHSADQAGSSPGPDYSHGWGLMNAHTAGEIMGQDNRMGKHFLLREMHLAESDTILLPVWASGDEPLKATIVWTDPPGFPPQPALNPPDLMLVNDLDMRLIHVPSDSTHYPYILDPASPAEPATTGDNFRDNVEQIRVGDPAAGDIYWLQISHKGSLQHGGQNFSLAITGIAQSTTFSGPGADWDDPGNWTHGLPGEDHNIIISAKAPSAPVISDDVTSANLLLEAGATLTIEPTGTLTVDGKLIAGDQHSKVQLLSSSEGTASLIHDTGGVPVSMELSGEYDPSAPGHTRLISTPVTGQSTEDFFAPFDESNYSFQAWDESSGSWQQAETSTGGHFVPGRGYLISWDNTPGASFNGEANVGDIQYQNLSITPGQGDGWHLLGNPFASGLMWDANRWGLSNISHTAKLWQHGGYVDVYSREGFIPSTKGFFIQATGHDNALTIPADARVHAADEHPMLEEHRIVLEAKGLEGADRQQSVIRFVPDASYGIDHRYDAMFLPGYGPVFHALKDDAALSTIALPGPADDQRISYHFAKTPTDNMFEIRLLETNVKIPIYLYDRKTAYVFRLTESNTYVFSAGDYTDDQPRFELQLSDSYIPTHLPNQPDADAMHAWYHSGRIYFNAPAYPLYITMYDVQGRLVMDETIPGPYSGGLTAPRRPGLYVLRMTGPVNAAGASNQADPGIIPAAANVAGPAGGKVIRILIP